MYDVEDDIVTWKFVNSKMELIALQKRTGKDT